MFLVQCEESRINHLTPLLVMTMPYAYWILWQANYIEDFKRCLHFQIGVALWRAILREVYFEGPNRGWRALKTSILNTAASQASQILVVLMVDSRPRRAKNMQVNNQYPHSENEGGIIVPITSRVGLLSSLRHHGGSNVCMRHHGSSNVCKRFQSPGQLL